METNYVFETSEVSQNRTRKTESPIQYQERFITRQYPYQRNRRQHTNMLVLDSRWRMVMTHYNALFLRRMTESNHRWCQRSLCTPGQLLLAHVTSDVLHVTKSEQLCHSETNWQEKWAFLHQHSLWIDTIPMEECYRKSLFDLVSKYFWYYAEARWLCDNCSDRSSLCNPLGTTIDHKIKKKQD